MTRRALTGADIFDGQTLHTGCAILLDDAVFAGIVPTRDIPAGVPLKTVPDGTLLPGFVDLQVNGGGGVMFNDATDIAGLETIARAHFASGTRALLPTLITDTPQKTQTAIDAVEAAIAKGVPGIIGIHIEGPHLSIVRKGAHDASLIRPMTDEDETRLIDASSRLPNVMVTVAPETVGPDQIARLVAAGVVVSLGHSDCSFEQASAAFSAGAVGATHLFNAMSQLGNREPGLVGATLNCGAAHAGLIADGIHVHPATLRAALAVKSSPGALFLVSDAMATAGSEITEFRLNGRRVLRRDGRLTLEDGTLAGADLDLPTALAVMIDTVGLSAETAFAMATSIPARLLRDGRRSGAFETGAAWTGIHLTRSLRYDPDVNAALRQAVNPVSGP